MSVTAEAYYAALAAAGISVSDADKILRNRYAYPIDEIQLHEAELMDDWRGWLTEKEYIQQFTNRLDRYCSLSEDIVENISGYLEFRKKVLTEILDHRGDTSFLGAGPYIAGLPNPEIAARPRIIIAWECEGSTKVVVASEIELAWLPKLR